MEAINSSSTSVSGKPLPEVDTLGTFIEQNTAGLNFACKTEGCKGRVVKRISGANSQGYLYRIPDCNHCGRKYLNSGDAPVVGIEEFQRCMNNVYF
jgi:hypothetical protein